MEHQHILDALNWRYATKKFDSSKKISTKDLETLKEVLRLTPSSYGLQPWKFLIIENQALRQQLREKSWGQSQVTDASHLIVFCSYLDLKEEHIDNHIANTSITRNQDIANLAGYGNFVKKTLSNLSPNDISTWSSKQLYIALGQLMLACAEMKIDATPMEGFEPAGYDEILGLKAKNLHATLVCPIGYRHVEDDAQFNNKVRKSGEEVFETI
jgi:nitroreductase / dihydropteridine reductase